MKGSQKILKYHMRAMNKIFKRGENTDMERVWSATELQSTVIPNLGVTPKDHKPLEENGDPKTHPLCFAKQTINGEMSEFTASYMDPAASSIPGIEVISTEETANRIDKLNKSLMEKEISTYSGLVVGSLDATAFYPSLLINKYTKWQLKR